MTETSITATGNNGDVEIYLSALDEFTDEFLRRFPCENNSANGEYFTALLHYLYVHIFRPEVVKAGLKKSRLDYDNIEELDRIFDAFVELCARFRQCPTIYGFCVLTGINRDTLADWSNGRLRSNDQERVRTVKNWHAICESALAQRAISSNSVGAIFSLKCAYSWVEASPTTQAEVLPEVRRDSPEEIAARHRNARLPEMPDLD